MPQNADFDEVQRFIRYTPVTIGFHIYRNTHKTSLRRNSSRHNFYKRQPIEKHRYRYNQVIPLSHLRTDAADRGRMLYISRDPRGIRIVCVLYPYCVRGFPPRSAAIRSPILKMISCFTYAANAAD